MKRAILIGFVAGSIVAGCASPLTTAVDVANGAAETEKIAAPVLAELCVEPMKRAMDAAAVKAIEARCDVPVAVYDEIRTAHVALLAGIGAVVGGASPLTLVPLVSRVVASSSKLATTIGGVK